MYPEYATWYDTWASIKNSYNSTKSVSRIACYLFIYTLITLPSYYVYADRIKDLATIEGIRSNQLIGYGLVVGLDGTGDNTQYSQQSFNTMLSRLGINLPEGTVPNSKNMAAVVVHANLPPFAKNGQTVDITASSIGNAKSLRGGTLLLTPLKGLDGKIYAVAQGNLIVGGFGVEGADGSQIKVNIPSVGRIPGGANIEASPPTSIKDQKYINLILKTPDFTTANLVATTINNHFGNGSAQAQDSNNIRVGIPTDNAKKVQFIATLENLQLQPGNANARVVVNSRTGTIVIGNNVRIGPAAITHGSLIINIKENQQASQPTAPLAGETEMLENSEITVDQGTGKMFMFPEQVTLQEIVNAINSVGASPGDLIAILESLKAAGALHADIEVI